MKFKFVNLFAVFAFLSFVVAQPAAAQEKSGRPDAGSKYVISAEAGGVNYVSGRVSVTRAGGRGGLLLKGDNVKIGDRVTTAENGRAEILLNPGSYIRLGGDSGFEFVDTSLENLQIKVFRGSAMFEVITSNDFTFAVVTPKASFNVVKSGIYRVDVLPDGTGRLEVRKGQAIVGEDEAAKIKKGKAATVAGDDVAVAKFDRGERDDLEDWSRDRARQLDRINDRLQRDQLRNTLIYGFRSNRWSIWDSFGLWVYDPFWSNYCFLPYGYGWSSPYGYRFGRDIWWFRIPRGIFVQQIPRVTRPRTDNNQADTGRKASDRRIVPPFEKIDRANNGGGLPRGRTDTTVDRFPGRVNPRIIPTQTTPETRQPSQPTMRRTKGRGDN